MSGEREEEMIQDSNGFEVTQVPIPATSPMAAPKATGPRSQRGKAISSRNALRHGFFAKELSAENSFFKGWKAECQRILKALKNDWKPVGATEELLVEVAATQAVQYRRLLRVHQAVLLEENTPPTPNLDYIYRLEAEILEAELQGRNEAALNQSEEPDPGEILDQRIKEKWGDKLDRRELLSREHERIEKMRRALPRQCHLEWLQRCENHILRHFYRALSELERLQRMRLGEKVPPRCVLEVRAE